MHICACRQGDIKESGWPKVLGEGTRLVSVKEPPSPHTSKYSLMSWQKRVLVSSLDRWVPMIFKLSFLARDDSYKLRSIIRSRTESEWQILKRLQHQIILSHRFKCVVL